jgi:hypothetical protein
MHWRTDDWKQNAEDLGGSGDDLARARRFDGPCGAA